MWKKHLISQKIKLKINFNNFGLHVSNVGSKTIFLYILFSFFPSHLLMILNLSINYGYLKIKFKIFNFKI
jgi:hypothetical protein